MATIPATIESPADGSTVTLAPGNTYLTQPIQWERMEGVTIRGDGTTRSQLHYVGPGDAIAIAAAGRAYRCRFEHFDIVMNATGQGSDPRQVMYGFLMGNMAPPGRISSANLVHDVVVQHLGHPGAVDHGFGLHPTLMGGTEGNNEQHDFLSCRVESAKRSGFHLCGSQAHQIVLTRCHVADAEGRRPYGVWSQTGSYFRWQSGAMGFCSVDFYLGTPEHGVIIDDHDTEHSHQVIKTHSSGETWQLPYATGAGTRFPITLTNSRIALNILGGLPAIDVFTAGPTIVENNQIAGVTPGGSPCPTIRLNNYTGFGTIRGSLRFKNNLIRQHGGTAVANPSTIVSMPGSMAREQFDNWYEHIANGTTASPIYI